MLAQQVSKIWFWNLDLRTGRIGLVARARGSESKAKNQMTFDTLVENQVYPEDRNRVHAALDRAVENRSPYVVEYRIIDDHKVRWIASQGTVFVDRSGNPVSIIGMSADITEHKAAEENRVRGDVLLNSIVEGVIYLNAQGKLIYLNAAAERLLGSRKHAYGVETAHDSCPIIDVVNTGKPYRNHDDYFQRHDGTFLNVEYTSAPLLLDGSKAGAVLTFRDIGERKRREQVLRNSERLAVSGRMAATLSHEINNPLESVSNFLYLIGDSKGLSPQDRAYLEMAEQELGRMAQIVKQTLTFNRESSAPVPVKLAELIDGILLLYERKLIAEKIRVVRRFDYSGEIRAFPGEMRQVFSNLIVNAAEAMADQGTLRIHIRSSPDWRNTSKRGVRVTVMDTGVGIGPENSRRLFQLFFTTKGEKGTGIGLWVSNEIVKRHGEAITVRSSTREGLSYTAFSVFLPLREVVPIRKAKDEFEEKAA